MLSRMVGQPTAKAPSFWFADDTTTERLRLGSAMLLAPMDMHARAESWTRVSQGIARDFDTMRDVNIAATSGNLIS